MNCGESKVKMTLSRLRLQLKGVLEREGYLVLCLDLVQIKMRGSTG